MLLLALDCSSNFCSVAVYSDELKTVLASQSLDIGRGHAERLCDSVHCVLTGAGVELCDISKIAVIIGPGSFAGIRVGVAFARGLALALAVPCVGVNALEAIAIPAARRSASATMAVLDARRERVFMCVVDGDGSVLDAAAELTPENAAHLATSRSCQIIGTGAALLAAINPDLAAHSQGDLIAPHIEDVARLAMALDPAQNPAEPLYLRDADAKPQAGFAIARQA